MLDLPGHGLSEHPDATYAADWYGRVVAQWLVALGLENVDLVGHSLGSAVAQMALLECSERIRRLVLVSSCSLSRPVAAALRVSGAPRIVERFGQPLMRPVTRVVLYAMGHLRSETDVIRLATINGQRGSARAFARTLDDLVGWRDGFLPLEDMQQSKLPPIAVFWGVRDRFVSIAYARDLARRMDGIRLVEFARSGHLPHHEDPQGFERALRDFLDAPSVPRSSCSPRRVIACPAER